MQRLRRVASRAEKRGLKKTIGSVIFRPRAFVRALFPAFRDVRWVRSSTGKSGLQQRWERAALVIFLRMDPDAYYLLGLHDSARYARAGEFVTPRQLCNLHACLAQAIDPAVRDIVSNKGRFFSFCLEHAIATPEVLTTWHPNGAGFDVQESAEGCLRRCGETFFKPQQGLCGIGAGILTVRHGQGWSITSGSTRKELKSWVEVCQYLQYSNEPVIFQPRLRNHRVLARFGEHAVHTVRIATMRLNGDIQPCAAFLKIAAPGAIADNFAAGSIAVHVDMASGRLGRGATKAHSCLPASLTAVPGTGERFAGLTVPHWRESLALARRLHRLLDDFPSLAMDIAVTDDGPVIVEANEIWGSDGFQKASDIGLGRWLLPAYCAEHFRRP
jgi:hypothetical protein